MGNFNLGTIHNANNLLKGPVGICGEGELLHLFIRRPCDLTLEGSCQYTGDTFEDLCTGALMEMEEAREEGESRVVAEPEEGEEEEFSCRYIWGNGFLPRCTMPGGVLDCITEFSSQCPKLFRRVGNQLRKHLGVHQDLAAWQHLLLL